MSFEEKQSWVYLAVAIVVPAYYAVWLLGRLAESPVSEIGWQGALIAATIVAVVATVAGAIITSISKPSEVGVSDQRDKDINRKGEAIGVYALSAGALGAMALTMLEVDHLWIGTALYGAFILNAITTEVIKLVAYRRGF